MDIDECVELANYADECGLDGVMIISPWYFRLTDEGIYTFYSQIARRTAAKIFIYNFPERTGYSVSPEVCLRLASEFPNIIGLKDTIPDTNHTSQVIRQVKSEVPYFEVYAGYDNNFAHNVLAGAMDVLAGYPIFALKYSATGCRHLTITMCSKFRGISKKWMG